MHQLPGDLLHLCLKQCFETRRKISTKLNYLGAAGFETADGGWVLQVSFAPAFISCLLLHLILSVQIWLSVKHSLRNCVNDKPTSRSLKSHSAFYSQCGKPLLALAILKFCTTAIFRENTHAGQGWRGIPSSQQRASQQAGFTGFFSLSFAIFLLFLFRNPNGKMKNSHPACPCWRRHALIPISCIVLSISRV